MGIKGIYGEIGDGERIALQKLSIEKFEQTRRPLRIAIDVSIWQFQTQSGQGGTNPAIRTFYYRLLRLLSVSVQPLFVFDGPHKPKFKRNRRVGQGGAMVPNLLTKQMLKLFGFPFHMAPGEAEAECALLQKEGIVDAVLSEDVDTLMFGCGTTLRNWTADGTKGNKTPTHVTLYDSKATKEGKSKLDREGMVLVALMSGGDYITEGIPGCGIKLACEAARAGYGKSLCQIPRSDDAAFQEWRANLVHEVQTNESKFFKTKHKALKIPEDFPNKEVLGYYTHPVVSSSSKIQKLKDELVWDGEIDVQELRIFVGDAFEWTNKGGAIKFIRGLAPVLLVHKLRVRGDRRASGYGDLVLTAIDEMELVRSICGERKHISTDGISELRVVYHPNDIVKLDLEAELDDSDDYGRDGLAPVHDDDQIEAYVSDDQTSRSASPTKRGPSQFDPSQPDRIWIPHTIAKVGIPLKVEDYEESVRNPKKPAKKPAKPKAPPKKAATKGGMPKGALDQFFPVSKSVNEESSTSKSPVRNTSSGNASMLPPTYLAPSLGRYLASQPILPQPKPNIQTSTRSNTSSTTTVSKAKPKPKSKGKGNPTTKLPNANPWSLSQSLSTQAGPSITKPSTHNTDIITPKKSQNIVIDLLSSSPEIPRSPLPPPRARRTITPQKHAHSPTPPSSRGSDGGEDSDLDLDLPPLPSTVTRTRGTKHLPRDESSLTPLSAEKENQRGDRPSPRKKHSPDADQQSDSMVEGEAPEDMSLNRILVFSSPSPSQTAEQDIMNTPDLPPLRTFPVEPLSPSPPRNPHARKPKVNQFIDLISSPLPASPPLPSNTTKTLSSSFSQPPPPPPLFNNPNSASESIALEKKQKKKTHLLLRESIGEFQEVDDDELERLKMVGGRSKAGRGREKERRAFRYSQVEVLDLRN